MIARLVALTRALRWYARRRCSLLRRGYTRAVRSIPNRHPWLAWTVLTMALIAAVVTFPAVRNESRIAARAEFNVHASAIAGEIDYRIQVYGDSLHALRGLFSASHEVTREEFTRFVDGLAILRRALGLLTLSYAQYVPKDERAQFERRIQAETGAADFRINPQAQRNEYHVLTFFAPAEPGRPALGLDLGSEPLRRSVVERARDSGEVASSEPLVLLRADADQATSILLRLAIYRNGIEPKTTAERRAAYQGTVGAAIDLRPMLQAGVSRSKLARVRLRIYDAGPAIDTQGAPAADNRALLFDSNHLLAATAAVETEPALDHYRVERRMRVGDRQWTLQLTPRSDPLHWAVTLIPYLASLAIATIGILMFGLFRALGIAQSQATHDALTGLHNRHYMQEWFELELHRARRHHRPIGVILFDIDYFKRINDTLGHEGGDLVLHETGALLRRFARQSDIVCRHGGEEFVLLLPESTLEATSRRAAELLRQFRTLQLMYRGRPVGPITVSAGVAVFPQHGVTSDALMRHADKTLYLAKRRGRNRVVGVRAHTQKAAAPV